MGTYPEERSLGNTQQSGKDGREPCLFRYTNLPYIHTHTQCYLHDREFNGIFFRSLLPPRDQTHPPEGVARHAQYALHVTHIEKGKGKKNINEKKIGDL